MDSYATSKLKDITAFLQLIVQALGCIDDESLEINTKTLYSIIGGEKDEEREGDINGTLSEQLKALNDNIETLNTKMETLINHVDFLDDIVHKDGAGVGYLKVMQPQDGWEWNYTDGGF